MYKLQQLYGRIIWNIRDPRSGSTWFVNNLCIKLARTSHFFDILNPNIFGVYDDTYYNELDKDNKKRVISDFFEGLKQDQADTYKILNTHEYTILESISNYKDPILFRNLRRNKTEQFASLIVANKTQRYNVHSIYQRDTIPKIDTITVSEGSIFSFIQRVNDAEILWQTHAPNYENETVYYEDLLEGWESTILPIKFKMNPNEEDKNLRTGSKSVSAINPTIPIKLPFNYREIITNYDDVDRILKENLGPY